MKITKSERAVINEMRRVAGECQKKYGLPVCTDVPLNDVKKVHMMGYIAVARWHLAKLNEAKADTYMETALLASRGSKWKLNMAAPIGKPCDAPKKGRK